jgi:U6 snRNA-associated Sm-like protein LSm6
MSDPNGVSPPPAQEHEQPEQREPELPGPGAFLKSVVGQEVVVRLNSGVDYRGAWFARLLISSSWEDADSLDCLSGLLVWAETRTGVLSCLDGYMNIALEQTEEYVNGTKTNEYGDAFVRGNNGEWRTLMFCSSRFSGWMSAHAVTRLARSSVHLEGQLGGRTAFDRADGACRRIPMSFYASLLYHPHQAGRRPSGCDTNDRGRGDHSRSSTIHIHASAFICTLLILTVQTVLSWLSRMSNKSVEGSEEARGEGMSRRARIDVLEELDVADASFPIEERLLQQCQPRPATSNTVETAEGAA